MKFFIKLIKAACICIELAAIVLLAVGFDLHERVGNAKTVQIGQGSSQKFYRNSQRAILNLANSTRGYFLFTAAQKPASWSLAAKICLNISFYMS